MSDLSDLYQEMILDHGKRPRNHRVIDHPDRTAEGYNPLCGDRVNVFINLSDGVIAEICFTASGCCICTASASLMTQHLSGKRGADAVEAFKAFRDMLTDPEPAEPEGLDKLVVLSGVRRFPMRVKCATLPWHTMKAALETREDLVTTE